MPWSESALVLAPRLLGAHLVRRWPDGSTSVVRIVETEAYCGLDDAASHGRIRTARSEVMYGAPGRYYVYQSRGLHWMLNVVAEPEGDPAVVLVRAAEPLEGLEALERRRPGRAPREWTSGPGRLTQALEIDPRFHGADVNDEPLRLVWQPPLAANALSTGPRVGMGKTPEPWYSAARRWWITGNAFVSAYR